MEGIGLGRGSEKVTYERRPQEMSSIGLSGRGNSEVVGPYSFRRKGFPGGTSGKEICLPMPGDARRCGF